MDCTEKRAGETIGIVVPREGVEGKCRHRSILGLGIRVAYSLQLESQIVEVEMPVSSLLVHTEEPMTSKVASQINALQRARVTLVLDAEIIAITETATRASDREVWESIERIPGVLGLSLVYHNYEDLNEEEE